MTAAGEEPLRLSILIPAYNEEHGLPEVIEKLLERYRDDDGVEILVVDDGSSDRTAEVSAGYDKVRVLRHIENKGNGAAVKTGLWAARGEVMLILDADGQHRPEDCDKLIDQVGPYDLVVGARTSASDSERFRDVGNAIMARAASYLVRRRIPDLTSGFRAFKVPVMRQFTHLFPQKFSFPSTSTMCFITNGYDVKFEPIIARRREQGTSKIRPFRDGMRFMRIIFRLALMFSPTRFFVPVALLFMAAGAAWGIYTAISQALGLSVLAAMLLITGWLILGMAVLAEQQALILRHLTDHGVRNGG